MLESAIQSKIIKHCNAIGFYCVKVISANRSGTPDLLICVSGLFIGLEVKQPGKHRTPLQTEHAHRIEKAGGKAYECSSLDEFKAIIAGLAKE